MKQLFLSQKPLVTNSSSAGAGNSPPCTGFVQGVLSCDYVCSTALFCPENTISSSYNFSEAVPLEKVPGSRDGGGVCYRSSLWAEHAPRLVLSLCANNHHLLQGCFLDEVAWTVCLIHYIIVQSAVYPRKYFKLHFPNFYSFVLMLVLWFCQTFILKTMKLQGFKKQCHGLGI